MRKRLLLLPFISLFALSSCAFLDDFLDRDENTSQNDSGTDDSKTDTKTVAVTSVEFLSDSISIEEEESETLQYSVLPTNATNKNVTFESSNEEIARVENGTVYGVSVGNATVTVKTQDGNFTDTCSITVTEKEVYVAVTSVNITKASTSIEKGEYETLQYAVWPSNATNKNVTWGSSNKTVATVTNGVVYAHEEGSTVISIKTEDGNKTDTCNVTVTAPSVDPPDPKNGEFYGGLVEGEDYTGYEFSKSTSEIDKPSSGIGEMNIYGFNDFHGSVIKQGTEAGLKQIGTYFKEKSQENNSLIFDQGDTWQGSFESNYQYGAIIQDVFTYAGVTARTVGNHDFDWGLSHLESTINRKVDGDYMPCLAANVYDYEGGVNGTVQQSQYGKEYCTYVLDNGIKVGVVGVIGEDQITSICSQLVSTICFTNYVNKVKEISDFLRTEKDCDVIIASTHEGSSDAQTDGLTAVSSVSGKRYVDLVLGGHEHYNQEYTVDGVKYVQWSSNSKNAGKVTLKYDFATNSLVDEDTTVNTYNSTWFNTYYSTIDPVIDDMVDDYLDDIGSVANEELSTKFSGSFDTYSLARLVTEAIYDRVSKTIPQVQFAISNYAREGFSGTTFTYRDLYKSFPFDNQIILMDVSSSRGISSIKYNYSYRDDTSLNPTTGNTYKCAIIDYVAVHQDETRSFDNFPEASGGYTVFNDTSGDPPNYRDILYAYLKANPSKSFNAEDYTSSNSHFYK